MLQACYTDMSFSVNLLYTHGFFYRFSDIKFHKARGRNQSKSSRVPTDNAVKLNIWKSISEILKLNHKLQIIPKALSQTPTYR